jgi:hypothetical protein
MATDSPDPPKTQKDPHPPTEKNSLSEKGVESDHDVVAEVSSPVQRGILSYRERLSAKFTILASGCGLLSDGCTYDPQTFHRTLTYILIRSK